jgi:hypothetical protein
VDFHRSGVDRECFDLDTHDLFDLELFEDAVQYAILGPPIDPHVDCVPTAEPLGQPAPLTTLFGYIENCVEHLQVGQTDVGTLHR